MGSRCRKQCAVSYASAILSSTPSLRGRKSRHRARQPNGACCCDRSIPSSTPCSCRLSNTTRKTSFVVDPAWVALSLADHVGSKKLRALLAEFGKPRAVLDAEPAALRKVPGIGPKISQIIDNIDLESIETAIPR